MTVSEQTCWSAEADGNRTRQTGRAGLYGFEDRGAHQEPRRLQLEGA